MPMGGVNAVIMESLEGSIKTNTTTLSGFLYELHYTVTILRTSQKASPGLNRKVKRIDLDFQNHELSKWPLL